MNEHFIQASYFVAAILFVLSLRWLNHPRTARRSSIPSAYALSAASEGVVACSIGTSNR